MRNIKTLWKLLIGFALKLAFTLLLLAIGYRALQEMIDMRNWVIHSHDVLEKTATVYIDLLNIETGERGFAITGKESFLEPLQDGLASLFLDIDAIGKVTLDNPAHQKNVELLKTQSRLWVETEVNPLVALRRQKSAGPVADTEAQAFIVSERGKKLFDAMRSTLDSIRQDEIALLDKRTEQMNVLQDYTEYSLLVGGALLTLFGILVTTFLSLSITRPLTKVTEYATRISSGESDFPIDVRGKDEVGILADAFRALQRTFFEKTHIAKAIASGDLDQEAKLASPKDILGESINRMVVSLREARRLAERIDWIKSGINMLSVQTAGAMDSYDLANKVLGTIVPYIKAQGAALYLLGEDGRLALQSGYAAGRTWRKDHSIEPGEGLAGHAARERTIVAVGDIPDGSLRVSSSFGDITPRNIVALPFAYHDKLIGVLEIGAFEPLPEHVLELLRQIAEPVALSFDALDKHAKVRALLEETQQQAQELQTQQEELRVANEELEEQAHILRQSEEELKQQREELQAINEELEEKNEALEKQTQRAEERNRDLAQARREVERKAADLSTASRYKSEFLANMSHELRTPLNSLLLLARNLRDNTSGRLSPDDVESARIIYKSGNDLLILINDILDLSKVEAGKLSVTVESVAITDMTSAIESHFRHMAEAKGLAWRTKIDDGMPADLRTDPRRLEQILRNLVANAIKFTDQGEILLHVHRPEGVQITNGDAQNLVAFSVIDTGIGIPADKQEIIFQAFQQADGTTSRRYGGTGLGLSITRELARLLGGSITLSSKPGSGSNFTLVMPEDGLPAETPEATGMSARPGPAAYRTETARPHLSAPDAAASDAVTSEAVASPPREPLPLHVPDDRGTITPADKSILIIEDDPTFATVLVGLCRAKGFKALTALTGEEGLAVAEAHNPTGIILDIRLPGISGWTVLGSLKRNHSTRHIPVHIVSVHDDPHDVLEAQAMGAIGFLNKPVAGEDLELALKRLESVTEKPVKDLLLVEDNADLRLGIRKLLGDINVNIIEAETGVQALQALNERSFDCMILDIGLGDISGFEFLKQLEAEEKDLPPVIVYTGRELTRDEEFELRRYADSIIIKGARSEERLLDEVTLFLHRIVSVLPEDKKRMLVDLHNRDQILEGKRLLVVDDDMRNLFAVSKILTEKGLKVIKADSGAKALEVLAAEPVDAVLMDIMMPEMDGYEVIRRIRAQEHLKKLPIIALTAKAMKEDRMKCLSVGANDYLSKPVDVDRLVSMLRIWLYGK